MQMGLKPLGNIYHFEVINCIAEVSIKKLDFAFCELDISDLNYFKQEAINLDGEINIAATNKIPLIINETLCPDETKTFAVSGRIGTHISGMKYITQLVIQDNLKWRSKCDDYYVFDYKPLPDDSIEFWEGISGAPILEETGKVVGLTTSVNTTTQTI